MDYLAMTLHIIIYMHVCTWVFDYDDDDDNDHKNDDDDNDNDDNCIIGKLCTFRLGDITVGMDRQDFLTDHAQYCVKNYSSGELLLIIVRCVQPVYGRYLTIHSQTHADPADGSRCLGLCNVTLYLDSECIVWSY